MSKVLSQNYFFHNDLFFLQLCTLKQIHKLPSFFTSHVLSSFLYWETMLFNLVELYEGIRIICTRRYYKNVI